MGKKILRGFKQAGEDFFLKKIEQNKVPRHVAVIMDGNGRWAAKRGLPRLAGHRAGAKAVREVVAAAAQAGVEYLTLYTFSVENWKRPKQEVSGLMGLFEEVLQREIDALAKKNVRISVIGRLEEMPASTREKFQDGIKKTAGNDGLKLVIAVNYGGRTEITDAVTSIVKAVEAGHISSDQISPSLIARYLYTKDMPDPDLVIRTSGELRVSNFLLWQIAYAEFWITDILWPDFGRDDFYQALYEFQCRNRRFGRSSGAGNPPEIGSN
ncbi:MAG TPA: isoprenyl transferase [Actinobacteria bacterium]|nr:isoprenyl transferase [Actinomycetes bacterium]HEX21793.1 isoprenyl transferase [Actinomycetota bacterium]